MATNRSAFLTAAGQPLEITSTPMPEPGPDDIVIQNHAIAFNPLDAGQAAKGMFIKAFPHVLGSDVAGVVTAIGSNVTRFKPGDRVVGHCWSLMTGKGQDGAYNHFTNLPGANAAKVPAAVPFKDAVVLPLAIDTAVCGLFTPKPGMGLEWPEVGAAARNEVVVVYGASSSVGSMAVQLASGAGYRVIGIASKKNAELVKRAGAEHVFDYNDGSSVVDDVVKAVGAGPCIGIYDAFGTEASQQQIVVPILEKTGAKFLSSTKAVPEKLPEGVETKRMFGIGEFSFPAWKDFVGQALESGQLKCLPPPLVVGKGLESVQTALGKLAAGVSAQKVVIEL